MRMSARRSGTRPTRRAITAVGLGIVVVLAALARTGAARSVASWIGVPTAREQYTALSFLNASELGSKGVRYTGSRVHDRLGFVVKNEEHHAQRYGWMVSFRPRGRTYRGVIQVPAGQSATVKRRVLLSCNERVAGRSRVRVHRAQVRVRLTPGHEAIDYWQVCGG
jgi:hypothetical protein